jgi:glycerol-3-phosphate acyltransferase PlsY
LRRNHANALAAVAILGYLAGTLPSADIASRLNARVAGSAHRDLRVHGTGNPGGLNAAKVLGTRWGAAVMAADFAKGALACIAGKRIAGEDGAYVAGTAAVVGHCLPLWSGFRGGKGVATSAGSALVCFPVYSPFDTALVAALVRLSRGDANVAVVITSSAFTLASLAWWKWRLPNLWGPRPSAALPVYAAATSALLAWRMLAAPPTPIAAEPTVVPQEGVRS